MNQARSEKSGKLNQCVSAAENKREARGSPCSTASEMERDSAGIETVSVVLESTWR